ncbi:phosphatidylinositol 4-phosphate 5-kinase 9-like [Lotus japonicus]|uniref:phosphatidylinositol 4-phosphate 5-kinase 9-like n=1 Tax=Lotus japonicus TaxID=34305 RepID=UPI002584929A|nr:phosphatidylinositol 4-phosphate 5-kinase 9-like [Lotus japonicus]
MHQKKSEIQIGKESTGVSSDFNPKPPFLLHHNHHHHHHQHQQQQITQIEISIPPSSSSAPYKRPSLSKSQTLFKFPNKPTCKFSKPTASFSSLSAAAIRRLRLHLRLVLLLSLPFFYFLVTHPAESFLLDFLSAFAFSAGLLLSLHLAVPRLPSSIRFRLRPRPSLPVVWTVGWRRKAAAGCGVRVYANGDVYEGEFQGGKCVGSGVYYYSMNGRYEGDWVDGMYDGCGVETWARGSRYRGQYRQGLRHGFGVYRFYTGDVYAGEWSSGQSHGCGVHTCDDGSRYVGEFKWGVKHGLGHYHFRNGDTYAGEYFADKMHGFGVYSFANGHRYEGSWHEGKRQGLGMYTFRNGETQSGHWQNGILDIPSTQNPTYPVSPVGVNHSKVLNVVQEARRAAQKAYDVGKVDERVNRAVAGANRAANAARVAAVKAAQRQMHNNVNRESLPIPIV